MFAVDQKFWRRVDVEMARAGIRSYRQLSRLAGRSPRWIIERKRMPTLQPATVQRIAGALGVDVEVLIPE